MENNYVVYARWILPNGHVSTETLDVSASDWKSAKLEAEKLLSSDYDPGGQVHVISDEQGRKIWEAPKR